MTTMSQPVQTVVLPVTLDLTSAVPLVEQLLAARGIDLKVNAAQVNRIGGQCLQVLLSAAKTWRADGASFEIVAASPDCTEALTRFGVKPDAFDF